MTEDIEDPWCTPNNPREITYANVTAAAFKIKTVLKPTPCVLSHLCDDVGMQLYFKKEYLQYTGSFKERGALYSLLMLNDEQKKRGVIAASAGNHAQAMALHGRNLDIPVTVVMPVIAPILKIERCRHFKARVIVEGKDMAEAKHIALKKARDDGLMYINGYDHPHILSGQGTCGLEILNQVPDVDAVMMGVGGGGLLAGVARAIKGIKPRCKIYAVESDRCPGFANSLRNGKPTFTPCERTLADGLAVPLVGYNAFATAAPVVDKVVVVKDEWIPLAILKLAELEKAIIEGAGAVSLAAILAGQVDELKGKNVVVILSGGNIDTTALGKCLDRGLQMDGRINKFRVVIPDKGGLVELTSFLSSIGVQIKDIFKEASSDVFNVQVKVVIETTDKNHASTVKKAVLEKYPSAQFTDFPMPVTLEPIV